MSAPSEDSTDEWAGFVADWFNISPPRVLIGLFLGIILYGAIMIQVFSYFHNSKVTGTNRVWIRILVAYLFVIETGMIILNMWLMYRLVSEETDYIGSQFPPTVYTNWDELKRVPQNRMILDQVLQITFGTATFTLGNRLLPDFDASFRIALHIPFIWLACSAMADTVIAISFIVTLSRKKTGFRVTDTMVTRMTQLLIGTGAFTAIVTIIDAGLYYRSTPTAVSTEHPTAYVIPDIILSKLYTNSLLATLNARIIWQNSNDSSPISTSPSALRFPSVKILQQTLHTDTRADGKVVKINSEA
ncbi:hypothetical protein ONZ45_g16420 [Pleurotus djamor]|nr:hypothetical protein ONZ45_g16420 [Pleurotus djamor]